MNDPFSSAWTYLLLLIVSFSFGWKIARTCITTAFISFITAFVLRYIVSSLSHTELHFPSISVAILIPIGFWIILGNGLTGPRTISFLLFLIVVIANRLGPGKHTILEVFGGLIVSFLSIAIGKKFALRPGSKKVTSKELFPQWPDRPYIPQDTSYRWSRAEVAERYPEAVTPLFADLFLSSVGRAVQKMGRTLGIKKDKIIIGYCIRKGYIFSNMGPKALNIAGILRRFIHIRKAFLYYSKVEYPSACIPFWERYNQLERRLNDEQNNLQNDYTLLMECLSLFESWMVQQSISLFYVNFGVIYLRLVVAIHFLWKGKDILRALPLGIPTVSAQESELLYRLGKLIGNNQITWENLSGEAKILAEELLASLGDQSSSYDFTDKIWRQTPQIILDLAQSTAGSNESPNEQKARLSEDRKKAEAKLTNRIRIMHPFSGKRFSDELIQFTHNLYPLKEERQKQMAAAWALVKLALQRLGKSFACQVILRNPEDIYFLTASEISGLLHRELTGRDFLSTMENPEDIVATIRVRQNELQVFRETDIPEQERDEVLELPWKKAGSNKKTLSGKHTLPGQVIAPAVVIRGQQEFHKMQAGRILVAPATNPHWDVLFGMASGIIIERGGPQSHAILKASEYGIPAIIGLPNATKLIKDNDLIHLNGDKNELDWEGRHA